MLLRLTGAELIYLATRGAGLPPTVRNLQWTAAGVRVDVDLADLDVDSLTAKLAMRAAGVVQVELTCTHFDAVNQLITCAISVHARSLPMARLLHFLQDKVNSNIATVLVAHDLPADTALLDTTDNEPTIRIAVGAVMTELLRTSPLPAAHLTSVVLAEGTMQLEVDLAPEPR